MKKEFCANPKSSPVKQDLKENYHLASIHQNVKAAVHHLLTSLTVEIALHVQPH